MHQNRPNRLVFVKQCYGDKNNNNKFNKKNNNKFNK